VGGWGFTLLCWEYILVYCDTAWKIASVFWWSENAIVSSLFFFAISLASLPYFQYYEGWKRLRIIIHSERVDLKLTVTVWKRGLETVLKRGLVGKWRGDGKWDEEEEDDVGWVIGEVLVRI